MSPGMSTLRKGLMAAVLLGSALLPMAAGASTWCGDNGLIRFSFVEGDSLVSVLENAEPENGVTTFEVYAWLTDVAQVAVDGEAFLNLGGMEFALEISGAEVFILEQKFPFEALNLGGEMGQVAAGMHPGERIREGRLHLVRWKVMMQGRPENVRIGLKNEGLRTCDTLEGCDKCGPPALYVGNEGSRQQGFVVGAGYVPAWVNPEGEPDQTPVTGTCSWSEVGVLGAR